MAEYQDYKVEKVGRSEGAGAADTEQLEPLERMAPDKERFDSLLHSEPQVPRAQSVEEISKGAQNLQGPFEKSGIEPRAVQRKTPSEITQEINGARAKIGELQATLQTPGLEIDKASMRKLRSSLGHVSERLQLATGRGQGQEAGGPPRLEGSEALSTPIRRFLGILSSGDARLQNVFDEVSALGRDKAGNINPSQLLMLQMKVGFVTSELEFAEAVLKQATEGMKALMNTQL